jgi:ABC-2 type transport system ATP-binding protein
MTKDIEIETANINKYFKNKHILKNISLQVRKGEIYGILGPNGAGKTTLISILSGILTPDSGKIKLFGKEIKNFEEVKHRINIASGNPNFIWCMKVFEILNYFGMLYGIPKKIRLERIKKYSEILGLKDFMNEKFDSLSTGTKQRLALCKALLNEPEILFLDEPTVGLDPDVSIKIRNFIKRLSREKNITMIVTTHYMQEAETLCERISFLRQGEILITGTPSEVIKNLNFKIKCDVYLKDKIEKLKEFEKFSYSSGENKITFEVENKYLITEILNIFYNKNIKIEDIRIFEPDLEDVFIKLAK